MKLIEQYYHRVRSITPFTQQDRRLLRLYCDTTDKELEVPDADAALVLVYRPDNDPYRTLYDVHWQDSRWCAMATYSPHYAQMCVKDLISYVLIELADNYSLDRAKLLGITKQ